MSSESVKLQILHAAGAVFANRGFKSATIRDICAAAEVNVAAVNYYFGDKEQLYLQAVKLAHQLKSQTTPMPEWSGNDDPADCLHQFILTLLKRMVGEQKLWQTRLMMREVISPTEACRSLVEDYFRPQFQILLGIVKRMVPRETSPERIHQLALSVIGQCLFYLVAKDTIPMIISKKEMRAHYSIEQLAHHIASFSCAAIRGNNDTNSGEPWLSNQASNSRGKGKLKAK